MVKKEEVYAVYCDGCGKRLEDGDGWIPNYKKESDARWDFDMWCFSWGREGEDDEGMMCPDCLDQLCEYDEETDKFIRMDKGGLL